MQNRTNTFLRSISFPLLVLSCAAAPAMADLSYVTAPAPGGFIQTCASASSGGYMGSPGENLFPYFSAPDADLNEAPFNGVASASDSSSYSGGSVDNSASGTAGFGYVALQAANSAPNSSFFAISGANGGWSELFTINAPGLAGSTGYLQFSVVANGVLKAQGFAGSSSFFVVPYVDASSVFQNAYSSIGNSDLIGTSIQYGGWTLASYGDDATRSVAGYATFAVPFTFGTPFKLGVYSLALAGMRSSSSVGGLSVSSADFSSGAAWNGITAVIHGGAPVSGVKITSGSGFDWSGPVPVPPDTDFNNDGTTDSADLAFLLGAWGTPDADLNGDGTTDSADLSILLGNWGN